MVVAGSMIGSGIFIVTSDITKDVGSAGWVIAVWLITGFMTIVAAVSYGELSGMFPKAGGQYVYLREAFNPLAGIFSLYRVGFFPDQWDPFAIVIGALMCFVFLGLGLLTFGRLERPVLKEL